MLVGKVDEKMADIKRTQELKAPQQQQGTVHDSIDLIRLKIEPAPRRRLQDKVQEKFSGFVKTIKQPTAKEEKGEWITLPISNDELQAVFKRLGIDPKEQNFVVSGYECSVKGVDKVLSGKEDLSELNYLAAKLRDLAPSQQPLYEAALQIGDHAKSAKDLINLTENLSCYDQTPEITTPKALGELRASQDKELTPELKNHMDFASFGRQTAEKERGVFSPAGYTHQNENPFVEFYDGSRESIPEQYRLDLQQQEKTTEQPTQEKETVHSEPNQNRASPIKAKVIPIHKSVLDEKLARAQQREHAALADIPQMERSVHNKSSDLER